MKRRILWKWGKLNRDIMESAYKRAEANGDSDILELMEERALSEALAHCNIVPGAFLKVKRGAEEIRVTPETFGILDEGEREGVICFLGKIALMKRQETQCEIGIFTTPAIIKCPSCAAFQLLEELESKSREAKKTQYKIFVGGRNDFLGMCIGFLKKSYPWANIDVVVQGEKNL